MLKYFIDIKSVSISPFNMTRKMDVRVLVLKWKCDECEEENCDTTGPLIVL
jgi:hypothetical protein